MLFMPAADGAKKPLRGPGSRLTLSNFDSLQDGSTCAHIAASKGSVSVLKELMKFDKSVVISSRNRITDSTPLHIATEGGHYDVVK